MIKFSGLSTIMEDFMLDQSWVVDTGLSGRIQLVGIRGCGIRKRLGSITGLSMYDGNKITDKYDDTMLVFGRKRDGSRFSTAYSMSTKPGIASFNLPSYKSADSGCPVLQYGQYNYRRGQHKGKEALRQSGNVVVRRDVDNDTIIESTDKWDYPRWTGINIHAGGRSSKVGLNSSGCQVVHGGWFGQNWRQLHDFVYSVAAGQYDFHYTMIPGLVFGAWYDAKNRNRYKWLWYGSRGDKVRSLQEKLMFLGYYSNAADGVFGKTTHIAVRKYQISVGCQENGIVDGETGSKLGIF